MSSGDAAAFAAEIRAAADEAEAAAQSVTILTFDIAGKILQLRFFGESLLPVIVPAISHRRIASAPREPDLVLRLWSCGELGLPFPRSPFARSAYTPRGEITGLRGTGYDVAFDRGGRLLSLFDAGRKHAFHCVGDAALIPRFDAAEPIRALLSWFMRENGRQLMHAGAVGTPDGGVLLVGRSGAGKSNTALGLLASDLCYVGDDFCAVSAEGPPMAYSLYSTGKTRESDWERHPFLCDLAPNLDPERRDKVIYFLNEAVPDKLIASVPLKAILLLRRGGERCEIRPALANTALAETGPDSAMLLPGAGAEVLRTLGRLVRQLPCHELWLGPDPADIAAVVSGLLRGSPAQRLECA